MFVEQLRRAVEATPRLELTKISALFWKAVAARPVSEAQASALSPTIEARGAIPAPRKPAQRRGGSGPRSGASMERRRGWASSGWLPPPLAARFTLAEQAVLGVVAWASHSQGSCTLTIDHVAALAGVSGTTVRKALREARLLGLLKVEERRLSAWRNLPNRVTILSPEWLAWLKLRARGVGKVWLSSRVQEDKRGRSAQRNRTWAAGGQGSGRAAPRRDSGSGSV